MTGKFHNWSKLFILMALSLLVVIIPPSPGTATAQADHLTTEGFMAFNAANYPRAAELWQRAHHLYQESGTAAEYYGSAINLSFALERSGFPYRACHGLEEALFGRPRGYCSTQAQRAQEAVTPHWTPDPPDESLDALTRLGDILTQIGHYSEAETLLNSAPHSPHTQLAFANLLLAQAKTVATRSQLIREPSALPQQLRQDAAYILDELLATDTPPAIQTLAAIKRLNLPAHETVEVEAIDIHGLPRFQQFSATLELAEVWLHTDPNQFRIIIQQALNLAQTNREQAEVYNLLGMWTLQQGNIDRAIEVYQTSYTQAQASNHSDLAYQAAAQLAQLYPDRPTQQRWLEAAIDQLERVKSTFTITARNLPEIETDIQTIFRQYMTLLAQDGKPIVPSFRTMKRWAIDTYLKCSQAESSLIELNHPATVDPTDAVMITIIPLNDGRIAVVTDGAVKTHYFVPMDILSQIDQLKAMLNPYGPAPEAELQQVAKTVYDQLKLDSLLNPSIHHLYLNVDREFEGLSFAALYDGQHYLIETYEIHYGEAIQSTNESPDSLLAAGISEPNTELDTTFLTPIPAVSAELRAISQSLKPSKILLNDAFTLNRFTNELNARSPAILHMATHSKFSSDPRATALLMWDQEINPFEIGTLIRNAGPRIAILSSCETAQGGRLGLSGLAVQANINHLVATHELVDSEAAFLLMTRFYDALAQGQSISQSLQHAQADLIRTQFFHHPIYWSPFILIEEN
ncbi:MAG: CHAT domain-containing protein [Cyanothece sp. SIO2G6]|nr:CHAT domain-containing protein [Cyanothece sp. SIO2G6]